MRAQAQSKISKANNPIPTLLLLFLLTVSFIPINCFTNLQRGSSTLVFSLQSPPISRTGRIPQPKAATRPIGKATDSMESTEPLKEVRDGYLVPLSVGSPSQVIHAYLDTGSDLTWVPCGNLTFDCIDCDDYRSLTIKPYGSFSPSRSSSSSRVACTSPLCMDLHSSDNPYDPCIITGCSLSSALNGNCARPCPSFAYTYGGGVAAGTLIKDTLRVHGDGGGGVGGDSIIFGCAGSTYHEPIGIAGFGKGLLSLPSQLGIFQKGFFSYCFLPFKYANNPNISSPLVIGDSAIASEEEGGGVQGGGILQFTPMLKSAMYPNYYYVGLEAVTVGNVTALDVPHSLRGFDFEGNGGMMVDSGTTYTHLPEPFYSELLSALRRLISYPRAVKHEQLMGFDLCYAVPAPNNRINADAGDEDLPTIAFHFLNNVSLILPRDSSFYAVAAPVNSTVVKCLLYQCMGNGDGYGPAGVLGSFQQQNVQVVYDLKRDRIGFQATECASVAIKQGLHKP
ncbi:hypothetical protein SAY86_026342 [Trapa natans]|uniref:Peptidase A1 domain-containing protein n=1 Tax=Trapa natans TaxID=22666 RepID=A0AAN7KFM8_TRANT|nr:hypothetical protein SAY86_026342 [Trapa natans]